MITFRCHNWQIAVRLKVALILLPALWLISLSVAAQEKDWKYNGAFNFGSTIQFVYGKGQKFPGIKFFCGFSASAVYKNGFFINYGPSLTVYTHTVGANLNPLESDVQLDFINSVTFGGIWGGDLGYNKYYRTIGNGSFYNVALRQKNGVLLTSNFIFNNHGRHQIVGSLTGSFSNFTINYYNDGAAPIDLFPIADQFDRYWTGGIGIFFHNKQEYNPVEFCFDQFTGYEPLLYEAATKLGIQVPSYNLQEEGSRKKQTVNYNTSAYSLSISPARGVRLEAGVIGNLRFGRKAIPFGLQDIIHTLGHYALHPNNDVNRFYIGGTYQNTRYVHF